MGLTKVLGASCASQLSAVLRSNEASPLVVVSSASFTQFVATMSDAYGNKGFYPAAPQYGSQAQPVAYGMQPVAPMPQGYPVQAATVILEGTTIKRPWVSGVRISVDALKAPSQDTQFSGCVDGATGASILSLCSHSIYAEALMAVTLVST
jgi:hypothetical protein